MINASFKVYWTNPAEMVTEVSPQQIEFLLPLGAIIADPNGVVNLSNYDTRVEVDAKVASANTYTNYYNDLLSQRANVREQLNRLPSGAWMTKLSLEARLSGLQETINNLEASTG